MNFKAVHFDHSGLILFWVAIIPFLLVSSFECRTPEAGHAVYVVKALKTAGFVLDGKPDDSQWAACNTIQHFISPWVPSAKDQTVFRAFHDDHYFYFSYTVKDTTLTLTDFVNEESVLGEDRVELFLSQTPGLEQYFGFEMDPQEKMIDYEAGADHHFNFNWNTTELVTKTQKRQHGYDLEGRVPLSFIQNIGIQHAKKLAVYAGVFRADFYGSTMNDVTWFAWQRPVSDTPNFHIPSSFGIFEFEKAKR